jgi:hypothetical protein
MNTTKPELPRAPLQPAATRAIGPRPGSTSPPRPTWAELLDERMAMIGAPAFFGPPIIFVLGPWLLLVFLLIGPLALLLTGLLVMAAAAGLLAVLAAVIASPYLLFRHLHAHGRLRVEPRALLHLVRTHRGRSRRPGSLQPKGMS